MQFFEIKFQAFQAFQAFLASAVESLPRVKDSLGCQVHPRIACGLLQNWSMENDDSIYHKHEGKQRRSLTL